MVGVVGVVGADEEGDAGGAVEADGEVDADIAVDVTRPTSTPVAKVSAVEITSTLGGPPLFFLTSPSLMARTAWMAW